jgi:SAM-dependent methyltransferase
MTLSTMKNRLAAFEKNGGSKPLDLPRYRIEFPPPVGDRPDQHEAYFYLADGKSREKIRFHDYAEIYARPGLYEQLFYDRLKCKSPRKVADVLQDAVTKAHEHPSELRVLDLGAGNGMVGEELASRGVSRLVGVDIIDEARQATIRDRPGVYDHYYVADFTELDGEQREEMRTWSFNGLVSVAALGFGDIPPRAVAEAMELVQVGGWIAFNIKDSFLDASDESGFSTMVRQLIFSEYLDLHHLERYQHRFSIDGTPLNYFAIVGRKCAATLPDSVQETVLQGG